MRCCAILSMKESLGARLSLWGWRSRMIASLLSGSRRIVGGGSSLPLPTFGDRERG